ncbi:nuclear transport factor 2 family protein [Pseudomonas sp. NPDC087342]|uniref:nuclear transport factor 2 family protein n=1 Tax=Pseudomonas sp. NPDC087342 TaxID=3364437 RepID=UPI00381B0B5F
MRLLRKFCRAFLLEDRTSKCFADPDVAIAGSGLDENFMGAEAVQNGVTWVTTLNIRWESRLVVSWMRGDIAWAQIRIDGHTIENEKPTVVRYVATGIFQRKGDGWTWLYWGASEPQKDALSQPLYINPPLGLPRRPEMPFFRTYAFHINGASIEKCRPADFFACDTLIQEDTDAGDATQSNEPCELPTFPARPRQGPQAVSPDCG